MWLVGIWQVQLLDYMLRDILKKYLQSSYIALSLEKLKTIFINLFQVIATSRSTKYLVYIPIQYAIIIVITQLNQSLLNN